MDRPLLFLSLKGSLYYPFFEVTNRVSEPYKAVVICTENVYPDERISLTFGNGIGSVVEQFLHYLFVAFA